MLRKKSSLHLHLFFASPSCYSKQGNWSFYWVYSHWIPIHLAWEMDVTVFFKINTMAFWSPIKIKIPILFESSEYTVIKAADFRLLMLPRKHKKRPATVARLSKLSQTILTIIVCPFFGRDLYHGSWLHLINLPLNPPNFLVYQLWFPLFVNALAKLVEIHRYI